MSINKRGFLKYAAASLTAFVGYSIWRGFRYPPLMWTIHYDDGGYSRKVANIQVNDAILLDKQYSAAVSRELVGHYFNTQNTFFFRAYAPEPIIRIQAKAGSQLAIFVNNVHPETFWVSSAGQKLESTMLDGTNQMILVTTDSSEEVVLIAQFQRDDGFRFAAIGDTGGDLELDWCIERAKQLKADAFINLGDFVYSKGDYSRAIRAFHQSDIPCYVSIGNHDFHDSGKIFQPYIKEVGVFSHHFRLHDVDFINIDSANDFFPPSAGERGDLLKRLARREPEFKRDDSVVFSHRPLKDMRHDDDHHINGVGEGEWLQKIFREIGVSHYLCGHVHHKFETDLSGVLQLNAGQGLGYEDLLLGKSVSEILILEKERGLPLKHIWQPLNMPSESYANSVHIRYLNRHEGILDTRKYEEKYPNLKQPNS